MNKRKITKVEKIIANDILSRSNYSQEEANNFAKIIVDFGYTIHEQDFYKFKNAIKILKTKKVNITLFTTLLWNGADVNDYNLYQQKRYYLTKQEYELLKEVLNYE